MRWTVKAYRRSHFDAEGRFEGDRVTGGSGNGVSRFDHGQAQQMFDTDGTRLVGGHIPSPDSRLLPTSLFHHQ